MTGRARHPARPGRSPPVRYPPGGEAPAAATQRGRRNGDAARTGCQRQSSRPGGQTPRRGRPGSGVAAVRPKPGRKPMRYVPGRGITAGAGRRRGHGEGLGGCRRPGLRQLAVSPEHPGTRLRAGPGLTETAGRPGRDAARGARRAATRRGPPDAGPIRRDGARWPAQRGGGTAARARRGPAHAPPGGCPAGQRAVLPLLPRLSCRRPGRRRGKRALPVRPRAAGRIRGSARTCRWFRTAGRSSPRPPPVRHTKRSRADHARPANTCGLAGAVVRG